MIFLALNCSPRKFRKIVMVTHTEFREILVNSSGVNVVYLRHDSDKFRLIQRRRARSACMRSSMFNPRRVRYIVFALFLAFALGLRANASVAIPA